MKAIKFFAMALLVVVLASCNKEGNSYMRMKMTDDPGDYDKVLVDIQQVQIHYSNENDAEAWVNLETNAGVYDLLTLQNGITTVLADDTEIPNGSISQIRLILGANNSVVIDSVAFPLKTPSAMQSGLKINVNAFLEADKTYEVLIDFDAAKSIVVEGNGTFSLKPTIRVESIIEL